VCHSVVVLSCYFVVSSRVSFNIAVCTVQLVSAEGSSVSDSKSQGAAELAHDLESVGGDNSVEKLSRSSDGQSNNSR